MKNPTLQALAAVDPADAAGAWALVREVPLHVPALLAEGGEPQHFITIESHGTSFVVALTHPSRKPGGFRDADTDLVMRGSELASRIPEGSAIILDPGHADGRVFLPPVFAEDRPAS